ncbi:MAG: type I-E CRISPR-associated protein Cse1/CasA [Clostridiales bacterium]|nr:type I-E CRISPR-associated protein Cse1/CasA [Clostridiales bacterium]
MNEKEFNLIREPWILAMKPSGEVQEVSLLDVFRRAPEFQRLAGELPTQDVAVMRLLLAVLHAVFARYNSDGDFAPIYDDEKEDISPTPSDALNRWKELWDRGSFPMKIIEEYLTHYEERFYLFHPKYPFYQVAELENNKESNFGPFIVSKMNGEVAESDHKVRLFSQRAGIEKEMLSFSEAARWLAYVQGYAETFGKLESKGKTKDNDLSIGVGWLGKLGIVFASGDNLFETLMLNLILLKDKNECWGIEKPVWKSEHVISQERRQIAMPDNLSELYTLQSRRLLLHRRNGYVSEYSFRSGDFFSKINAFSEPMTMWRKTSKEGQKIEFQPKKHDFGRQFWRDFSGLLSRSGDDSDEVRRPGIVKWLDLLLDGGLISNSLFIIFHALGVKYGNMSASIEDVFCDNISFNARLLTSMGREWSNRIIGEIEMTDKLVEQVGVFAQNIAKASGHRDGIDQKRAAKEQAYYLLDIPFRRWVAGLDPENDEMSTACDVWWEQEKTVVRDLGRRMMMQSGASAFAGREIKERKQLVTSPGAYNHFLFRTSTRERLKGGKKNV